MSTLKKFRTELAMSAWMIDHEDEYEMTIVSLNNWYAVEYRPLATKEIGMTHTTKPRRQSSSGNTITEISHHDISWYVDNDKITELDEGAAEHIEDSIKSGYSSGELLIYYGEDQEQTAYGWWHIINWREIALDLYNASKSAEIGGLKINTLAMKKAIEQFDKEWTF